MGRPIAGFCVGASLRRSVTIYCTADGDTDLVYMDHSGLHPLPPSYNGRNYCGLPTSTRWVGHGARAPRCQAGRVDFFAVRGDIARREEAHLVILQVVERASVILHMTLYKGAGRDARQQHRLTGTSHETRARMHVGLAWETGECVRRRQGQALVRES